MCTVDKEGHVHFIGRESGIINTGGEKVFSEEVEDLIKTYAKVQNTCIVGVPDERFGQAVTAVIQLKEGEQATEGEIIDFCRGKLAGYKKPRHVLFVDELPVQVSGKVEKFRVQDMARQAFREIKK